MHMQLKMQKQMQNKFQRKTQTQIQLLDKGWTHNNSLRKQR